MSGFKYVVFQMATEIEEITLFATTLSHREMSQAFCSYFRGAKPIRAGFCGVGVDGTMGAYGDSESLKLKSDPVVDSRMLNNINYRGF